MTPYPTASLSRRPTASEFMTKQIEKNVKIRPCGSFVVRPPQQLVLVSRDTRARRQTSPDCLGAHPRTMPPLPIISSSAREPGRPGSSPFVSAAADVPISPEGLFHLLRDCPHHNTPTLSLHSRPPSPLIRRSRALQSAPSTPQTTPIYAAPLKASSAFLVRRCR